jgi:hypothetical protein
MSGSVNGWRRLSPRSKVENPEIDRTINAQPKYLLDWLVKSVAVRDLASKLQEPLCCCMICRHSQSMLQQGAHQIWMLAACVALFPEASVVKSKSR